MARCNYKNSLRGCTGDGLVASHVILYYNLREDEHLDLCESCAWALTIDVLKELEKPGNEEVTIYVFDLNYNLILEAKKDESLSS